MRSKRPDTLLERALSALTVSLGRTGVPFMAIGGVAVIVHGVKRMTTDLDVVVKGGAVEIKALVRALARDGIAPRTDDVERFARENLVLLMRHTPTGVDIDLSLGFTHFEHEALSRHQLLRFGTVTAPFARPDDLVVFKALAARPKDIHDATALLVMHEGLDLERVRRRVTELAALAEAPELVDGLELMVARAAKTVRALAKQVQKPREPERRKKVAKPATSARRKKAKRRT